jgi:hippurate hydrolase
VTPIRAGDAYNVIPQTAVIRGTFRTFSNDTMNQIENGMRRIASGVAAAFGATANVDFPDIFAPLVNDPAETKFIADAAADVVGEAHVDEPAVARPVVNVSACVRNGRGVPKAAAASSRSMYG